MLLKDLRDHINKQDHSDHYCCDNCDSLDIYTAGCCWCRGLFVNIYICCLGWDCCRILSRDLLCIHWDGSPIMFYVDIVDIDKLLPNALKAESFCIINQQVITQ